MQGYKEGWFDIFWNKIQTLLILDPWVQREGGGCNNNAPPQTVFAPVLKNVQARDKIVPATLSSSFPHILVKKKNNNLTP